MSTYSVADAEIRLSELIDRALGGERVVIARDGRPLVELRPVARSITAADVDWVVARRVGKMPSEDAATLVSRMRDEGEK